MTDKRCGKPIDIKVGKTTIQKPCLSWPNHDGPCWPGPGGTIAIDDTVVDLNAQKAKRKK